jgi:hypothetical protein
MFRGHVARELKVPYHHLFGLIRDGRIPAPARDATGRYLWSPDDLSRGRLRRRPGRRESRDTGQN